MMPPATRSGRLLLLIVVIPLLLAASAPPATHRVPTRVPIGAAGTGYVLPVAPPPLVLTPFTAPASRYGAGHRGVDLAAPVGSPILAAADGTVVFAGALAGRGVVSVEHAGGLRTTYEPVTARVRAGERVAAGGLIGALQAGHRACAPAACLHWGARLPDRLYLDPMTLLGPWRVRLWPWEGR